MAELVYNSRDMATVMFVEITYTDLERKLQEVKTEIKFVSDENFTVVFKYDDDFNIRCPQDIAIKYVIDNNVYFAETVLLAIKKVGSDVFLTIEAPKKIKQMQRRNYYRACLSRTCIVVAMNNTNNKDIFMSTTIDISAGGVLTGKLESALDNTPAKLDPDKYTDYLLVLVLDTGIVLNLSAKYIRTDWINGRYNYAFQFTNMNPTNINTISKYVAAQQVKKLGTQRI